MIQEQQPEIIGTYQGIKKPIEMPVSTPEPTKPEKPVKEKTQTPQEEMSQLGKEFSSILDEIKARADEIFKKQENMHKSTMDETTGKMKEEHSSTMEKTTSKMMAKHEKELAKKDREITVLENKLAKETQKVKDLQVKVKEALLNG